MWWIFALLSAFFAALTAIFAKIGIKGIDSGLALPSELSSFYFLLGALLFTNVVSMAFQTRRNKIYYS